MYTPVWFFAQGYLAGHTDGNFSFRFNDGYEMYVPISDAITMIERGYY